MVDQAGETVQGPVPATASAGLPAFKDCLAAVSGGPASGIDAIAEPPAQLLKDCAEMSGILASSAVRTSLDAFRRRDAEAVRQQTNLMQEATRANLCLMVAGIASGLVLALAAQASGGQSAILPSGAAQMVILGLGLLTLALGAAGGYFQYIARDQQRIARWRECRGQAEIARLDAFTTLANKSAAAASPAVALYGLAMVVRHLVNDQRSWFEARAARHRASSETTSRWGGAANALTFIGGSGAVIASQLSGAYWWLVVAGVFGAAIASFSANREALLQDRANADRYEKTRVAMDSLAGRTDDVADQIAGDPLKAIAGEPKALTAYTAAVTDLLSTEHKQWLEGTQQAEALLEKLDAQLQELKGAKKD
jgi:hypothetical protein